MSLHVLREELGVTLMREEPGVSLHVVGKEPDVSLLKENEGVSPHVVGEEPNVALLTEVVSVSPHVMGEELGLSSRDEELCVSLHVVRDASMSPMVEEQTVMWIPRSWRMTCEGQSGRVTYSQLVHLTLTGGEPWAPIECSSSTLMMYWAGQSTGVV